MRSKHKHCLSPGPRWTWIAAQLMRSGRAERRSEPAAAAPRIPGRARDAPLQRRSKQTPPLFLAPARKKAGSARLGSAWLGSAWPGRLSSLCAPRSCARLAALQMCCAADVLQPPPRSRELCRLRPLTANICCGCLLQAAWKQFCGERSSLAAQTITLY